MADIEEREALLAKEKELFELQKGLVGDSLFQDVRRRLIDNAKLWLGFGGAYLAFLTYLGLDAYLASSAREVVEPIRKDVEEALGTAEAQLAKIADFSERIVELEVQIDTLQLALKKSESLVDRQRFDRFFDEQFRDRMDNTIQDVQGRLILCWAEGSDSTAVNDVNPGILFNFDGQYKTEPGTFRDWFSLGSTLRREVPLQIYAQTIAGMPCVVSRGILDRFNAASPAFLDLRDLPPLADVAISFDRFADDKQAFEEFWTGLVGASLTVEINRENFYFAFNEGPFVTAGWLDAEDRVIALGPPVLKEDQTSDGEAFNRVVLPLLDPIPFHEMND